MRDVWRPIKMTLNCMVFHPIAARVFICLFACLFFLLVLFWEGGVSLDNRGLFMMIVCAMRPGCCYCLLSFFSKSSEVLYRTWEWLRKPAWHSEPQTYSQDLGNPFSNYWRIWRSLFNKTEWLTEALCCEILKSVVRNQLGCREAVTPSFPTLPLLAWVPC